MYYFAYGSNMKHRQMKQRCPSSNFIKRVYLEGYRFVYDGCSSTWKGAVANIIESKDEIVYGGLFEINDDNLSALDCYEGYPKCYDRKEIEVKDEKGGTYKAWTYFRTGKDESEPSGDYRGIVIQGAGDCELPEEYIGRSLDK